MTPKSMRSNRNPINSVQKERVSPLQCSRVQADLTSMWHWKVTLLPVLDL